MCVLASVVDGVEEAEVQVEVKLYKVEVVLRFYTCTARGNNSVVAN